MNNTKCEKCKEYEAKILRHEALMENIREGFRDITSSSLTVQMLISWDEKEEKKIRETKLPSGLTNWRRDDPIWSIDRK